MQLQDIWEHMMVWKRSLPQRQDALKRWKLALITMGLLMYPLAAESVIFTSNALRVQAAADFAVCGYPDTRGRFDTKLAGHDLGVRPPTINRHPQTGAVASISGHIVHIYNNWFDDQYYYVIPFQDGTNTAALADSHRLAESYLNLFPIYILC